MENINLLVDKMMSTDAMVVIILLVYLVIGLISGGKTQLSKFLHLVLPLLIIFLFGEKILDKIMDISYFANFYNWSSNKIPASFEYENTLLLGIYLLAVYVIGFVVVGIGLKIFEPLFVKQQTKVTHVYINSFFGGVISLVKGYIIVSILLVGFLFVGLVSKKDYLSNFMIESVPQSLRISEITEEFLYDMEDILLDAKQSKADESLNQETKSGQVESAGDDNV